MDKLDFEDRPWQPVAKVQTEELCPISGLPSYRNVTVQRQFPPLFSDLAEDLLLEHSLLFLLI